MNDKSKPVSDMPAGLNELSFGTGRSMLQITSMETAWRLAKLRSVAKTVQPDSPEALTICILYGQEVGLTPLMAMEKIALINGRPTIWGDGALALVMTNPLFEDIEEHIEGTGDERVAYCTVMRRGQSPKTRPSASLTQSGPGSGTSAPLSSAPTARPARSSMSGTTPLGTNTPTACSR